jgi:hypothetical protein
MAKTHTNCGLANVKIAASSAIVTARKFPPLFTAFALLLALLIMATALGAASSGQNTANPEVVIIPFGASVGSTSISWSPVVCGTLDLGGIANLGGFTS